MQNTNTVNTLVEIEHDNNLSGFSMSCTHMRMPHSYYFNLYQLRENVLFTASCDIEKNGKRITIQNKQVSQDFWDEFILLSKKLKICNFPEYEHVPDPETRDQTEYDMSLLFSEIFRRISINPDPETRKELEEFFYKKAKEANDVQYFRNMSTLRCLA
jgi:hypothetical protein